MSKNIQLADNRDWHNSLLLFSQTLPANQLRQLGEMRIFEKPLGVAMLEPVRPRMAKPAAYLRPYETIKVDLAQYFSRLCAITDIDGTTVSVTAPDNVEAGREYEGEYILEAPDVNPLHIEIYSDDDSVGCRILDLEKVSRDEWPTCEVKTTNSNTEIRRGLFGIPRTFRKEEAVTHVHAAVIDYDPIDTEALSKAVNSWVSATKAFKNAAHPIPPLALAPLEAVGVAPKVTYNPGPLLRAIR